MMKKIRNLFSLMAALAVVNAQAQPQGQQAPGNGLPLWEVGVFGGVASTPAYPGSSDRSVRGLGLPFFIYRGEILRADRGSVGARLVRADDFELDLGFAASLPARSDDVAARKGMPDLGTLIEFGPRMKMTLARPTPGSRWQLELPLRSVLEINGGVRTQGFAFEPQISYDMRDVWGGWSGSVSASVVVGDSKLNQYLYGVPLNLSSATRPAYEAKAGLITSRLGFSTSKAITPDLRVFGFVRYDLHAGAANRNSPLFLQDQGNSAGLGLTWTLGRSEARAVN